MNCPYCEKIVEGGTMSTGSLICRNCNVAWTRRGPDEYDKGEYRIWKAYGSKIRGFWPVPDSLLLVMKEREEL